MTSREQILAKIRANQPLEKVILPINIDWEDINKQPSATVSEAEQFAEVLKNIGGKAIDATYGGLHALQPIKWEAIRKDIQSHFFEGDSPPKCIINLLPQIQIVGKGFADLALISDAHDLASVDLAIIEGKMGVAENGAIWLDESCFGGHRVLPFITQHLIIVLKKENIVSNMHKAYKKIQSDLLNIGFGLFLAGPSKTADIEQSLVIGAHGARSLSVYLV